MSGQEVLIVYLVWLGVTVVVAVVNGSGAIEAPLRTDARKDARIALLSPLWPLLLVWVVVRSLIRLWHIADWPRPGGKNERKADDR